MGHLSLANSHRLAWTSHGVFLTGSPEDEGAELPREVHPRGRCAPPSSHTGARAPRSPARADPGEGCTEGQPLAESHRRSSGSLGGAQLHIGASWALSAPRARNRIQSQGWTLRPLGRGWDGGGVRVGVDQHRRLGRRGGVWHVALGSPGQCEPGWHRHQPSQPMAERGTPLSMPRPIRAGARGTPAPVGYPISCGAAATSTPVGGHRSHSVDSRCAPARAAPRAALFSQPRVP